METHTSEGRFYDKGTLKQLPATHFSEVRGAVQTVWGDSPAETPFSTPMQGPIASKGMLPVMHQASLHLHTHLSLSPGIHLKNIKVKSCWIPHRDNSWVSVNFRPPALMAIVVLTSHCVPNWCSNSHVYFTMNNLQNAMLWEWISFLKKKKKQTMAFISVWIVLLWMELGKDLRRACCEIA